LNGLGGEYEEEAGSQSVSMRIIEVSYVKTIGSRCCSGPAEFKKKEEQNTCRHLNRVGAIRGDMAAYNRRKIKK
jgi:hypothetical protein